MKSLGDLLDCVPYQVFGDDSSCHILDLVVSGVSLHSSAVSKGGMFAAFPGSKADGFSYVNSAIANGAGFILCDAVWAGRVCGIDLPGNVEGVVISQQREGVFLFSPEVRRTFSKIVSNFYGPITSNVVGITGTNGKSSTTDFLRQLWFLGGHKCASVGTLGINKNNGCAEDCSDALTTPDVVSLYVKIKSLSDKGMENIALEVSSHGLDQYRVDGINFSSACFTNLSQDHMDYHGDMNRYWGAKKRLFTEVLGDKGTAVVNLDTPQAEEIIEICRNRGIKVLSYGMSEGSDVYVKNAKVDNCGQTIELYIFGKSYGEVKIHLIGRFQLYNVLCAIAALSAKSTDRELDRYISFLPQLKGVKGRMELIADVNGAAVYVDFAHTPDGLAKVLSALRPHTRGKLKVIFGCGGDRDKEKRPIMGKVACNMADFVFVTDDNPRYEDPGMIRKEILSGGIKEKIREYSDRKDAIAAALNTLEVGDTLVIAGKGHEQSQTFKDKIIPFNDGEVVRSLLTSDPIDQI